MGKLLGIDYGDRRVGIAVSDEERTHAFARTAIQNKSRAILVDALKKLVAEETIDRMIAGLPLSMSGQEGPQATAVRTAMTDICTELAIPLEFEDERLSSSFADRFRGSSHDQDSIAAAAILESYLERTREKP